MDTWTIPPDPFAALGIERDSSAEAIKARYYELARKYHPNRNYAAEESRNALAEHFHRIHEAWLLLREVEQRRRYIELIQLAELQDSVEAKHIESGFLGRDESSSDEWSTSDADDYDLTHLSSIRRARSPLDGDRSDAGEPGHTTSGAETTNGDLGTTRHKRRGRGHERAEGSALPPKFKPHHEREGSDAQSAAQRRRRLEKLKRKELEAFYEYKDAMLWKLESEMEADRRREHYERAKAKREKIEHMPRETSTRVRLAQQINRAVNIFKSQATPAKLARRPTLNVRAQILASSDGIRDSDFLTVSSPSTTRGLSAHWRGYSADISGDQTSSEDNGDTHRTARRHLRSPSASARRRGAQRDTTPGAPRVATSPLVSHANGNSPLRGPEGPFKMIVKRPTGFENSMEAMLQDSDSASYSSRSPSPRPENDCRAIILFPSEAEAANEPGMNHRRTMSAPGQSFSRNRSDTDTRPASQGPMFEIKSIGQLRFPVGIPRTHVHRLSLDEERLLLKPPSDTGSHPQHLLERLAALDQRVASRFMVKKDIKDTFAFRLICNYPETVRRRHTSFISLSYRRKRIVEKHADHYTLPLSREMMQAVWDERNSEYEGLWVDQICIDQDSMLEQTISMSAMDEVYRNARLIVVVLDDLELKPHEAELLADHVREYEQLSYVAADKRFRRHQPPYLETHDDLFKLLQKMLTSAWFRRAWCRHEMRLAKEHVFLLPCHTVGSYTQTVLRMTSQCIAHLLALATEVPFSADIELLKPALHAFFRDRTRDMLPSSVSIESASHHGNFTTVVAEVFGMEAGGDPRLPIEQREADARRDKISIILNTMECGLALQPQLPSARIDMTKEECYYSLLLLALAARDPGALCSVGKPLQMPASGHARQNKAIYGWLFEPTNVDAGLNNYRTLDRLPTDAHLSMGISHGVHYVKLDLKLLNPTRMSPPSEHPDIFELAKTFLNICEKNKHGRHRKRYLITDAKANESFGSMREVYTETLACVFTCGPDWMTQVCHRYGVSRFKQDLQPACWLMVALRNMNGTWPKADWIARAASFIMDFVNFLVIRGMPQRQLREPIAWRPIWVATPSGGKVLTFRPPGDDVRGVVPTALLDADYVHLARLWMVAPRSDDDSDWTLLGKSVMFSDDLGLSQINYEGEMVRRRQRVFGRS